MALVLHLHPLSSFCHKVLIALYENGTPFEPHIVNLMDELSVAAFKAMWPIGKIPVLRDESRRQTIPETTIIIEYLERHYPGAHPLLPKDEDSRLEARLWDRIFDLYINIPLQKIVADRLRPDGAADPQGVAEAKAMLRKTYDMIEGHMAARNWAAADSFSMADCAAAPALFYAGIVVPFSSTHKNLAAYFERLENRPSFSRVLAEAKPYFHFFPFYEQMPARFR
jgi:glutathione S-transferase